MSCREEQGKAKLVWNSIQHGCKQQQKGQYSCPSFINVIWKGIKQNNLEKQPTWSNLQWFNAMKNYQTKSLLANSMTATWGLVCSSISNLLFCAEREQIILTRQIWQSACADCSQHESLDKDDHSQLQHQHSYTMWLLPCMICVGEGLFWH